MEPLFRCMKLSPHWTTATTSLVRGGGVLMRLTVLATAVCLSIVGVAAGAEAEAAIRRPIRIAAQGLAPALQLLAKQRDVQVVYRSELVGDRRTGGAAGELTFEEALTQLLSGTGLTYRYLDEKAVTIVPLPSASAAPPSSKEKSEALAPRAGEAAQRSFFERLRLAQLSPGRTASESAAENRLDTPGSAAERKPASALEEIIVTANRRRENIREIPMSITALDGEEVGRRGLVSLGDYLNTVPSVLIREGGIGFNTLSIRGIAGSGDSGDATVGNYFGEIPLTLGPSNRTIDLKLVDMERVEVLRGPQGTLYGASSLGGAVRKIPKAPELGALTGEVKLGYSSTAEKGGDNSQVTALANVPLTRDSLALRVAAYRFNNSGYIQNDGAADPSKVALANLYGAALVEDDNVNSHTYTGVRASLLWRPLQRLSATLMYINQDLDSDGHAEVDPRLSDYTIATFNLRGVTPNGREFFKDDHELANLVLEYDLGPGAITSSSSWLDGQFTWTRDNSRFIPGPLAIEVAAKMSGWVEELRFSSTFDGPLQTIVGLYYEDLKNDAVSGSSWVGDPALLPPTLFGGDPARNAVLLDHNVLHVEQTAVYGEVSYLLTQQLKLTAGGRWFDYERRQDNVRRGKWLAPTDFHESASEQGSRYKLNASYTLSDDALVYAQWAQGFRLGAPQPAPPSLICDVNNDGILDGTDAPVNPGALQSDSLDSYELGGKFTFLERRLTLDAAVFYIDWSDIPTVSPNGTCGFNVAINAAEAVSQGVELEGRWRLTPGLQLLASGSYIDAQFASDDLAAGARKGERLPGTAEFNALLGLQYDFNLAGNASYVRGDYGYIGKFYRTVGEQRIDLARSGDYGKLDMRFGMALEQFDLEVFGHNLTNVNAFTSAQSNFRGYQLAPRIVGINVSRRF